MGVLSEPCVLLNIVSITRGTGIYSLCYTSSLIQLKFSEHLVYVDEILYPVEGGDVCDLGLTIDTLLLGEQTMWEKRWITKEFQSLVDYLMRLQKILHFPSLFLFFHMCANDSWEVVSWDFFLQLISTQGRRLSLILKLDQALLWKTSQKKPDHILFLLSPFGLSYSTQRLQLTFQQFIHVFRLSLWILRDY